MLTIFAQKQWELEDKCPMVVIKRCSDMYFQTINLDIKRDESQMQKIEKNKLNNQNEV